MWYKEQQGTVPMNSKATKRLTIIAASLASITGFLFAQIAQTFPRANIPEDQRQKYTPGQDNTASDTLQPWYQFAESAKQMIIEEKFTEAKEALKTAIRIAPMNPSLWALYDEAVTSDYLELARREKINPVVVRDLQTLFNITRVDSYIELDTLYVVGNLHNISGELRQKIVLSAKLLDKNKKELRKESGTLIIPERGLMPNENSLFEIPIKNFPLGGKSIRVEVSAWE